MERKKRERKERALLQERRKVQKLVRRMQESERKAQESEMKATRALKLLEESRRMRVEADAGPHCTRGPPLPSPILDNDPQFAYHPVRNSARLQ